MDVWCRISIGFGSMLVSLSYYVNHGNVLDFPASLHEMNRMEKWNTHASEAGRQAGKQKKKLYSKNARSKQTSTRGLCVLIMNFRALHKFGTHIRFWQWSEWERTIKRRALENRLYTKLYASNLIDVIYIFVLYICENRLYFPDSANTSFAYTSFPFERSNKESKKVQLENFTHFDFWVSYDVNDVQFELQFRLIAMRQFNRQKKKYIKAFCWSTLLWCHTKFVWW